MPIEQGRNPAKPSRETGVDSYSVDANSGARGGGAAAAGQGAVAFEDEVIAIFVDMMQTLGLPKSHGEIYGLLYATPEPLSFAEINERLALSKGSVSGGLKALRGIGAVKVVAGGEDRRERFAPELEMRKLVLAYLRERIQPQLEANAARMARLDELLKRAATTPASQKVLQSRLGKLAKWREKASGIIPWVARFLR
ncbi:GbsR/MarR family transcriptional regulator [Actomonas aquatica]|uniref:Transcriptional regulator n=1 Tax=Actomonas aquatica TaxID=2866162 RepID=A0ABZ1CB18_9BACT|nr:transcriptional regulator [Opitutus sp. WL0086]WRQ88592.1 transcriptional regulator [Opitutus sp. WL0086]